ncbi:MAG TPA: toll/interleukin-1 receptor domain-containing protein [Thermoanaerobaculia bacterium]|nr:toll/interleukin-1 receptor domain-containing protein [Thermoanaerobaculia bacterium]
MNHKISKPTPREESQVLDVAQIFLSYTNSDADRVEKIYQRLSTEGFKPWMDKKDILPGEEWRRKLKHEIRRSTFFLACLSAGSLSRRGILQMEIKTALKVWEQMLSTDIYLIPLRLEACEVPVTLAEFQRVDLFEQDGWQRLLEAIRTGMERRAEKRWISGPESAPSKPIIDDLVSNTSEMRYWEDWLKKFLRQKESEGLGLVARESVEIALAMAKDRPLARAAFLAALDKVIYEWNPTQLQQSAYSQFLFLDLLECFTPSSGLALILHSLQRRLSDSKRLRDKHDKQIVQKCFLVLDVYFPISPSPLDRSTPAFRAYIELLKICLSRTDLSCYAVTRLISMEIVYPHDTEISDLLQNDPRCLDEILTFVLGHEAVSRIREDLNWLYDASLRAGYDLALRFEQALRTHSARLEHQEHGPVIYLPNHQSLLLRVCPDRLVDYMAVRWETGPNLIHPVGGET